jgi:HSP20 family protein
MKNTPDVRRNGGRASLGLWDEFDRMFENFFDTTPASYSPGRSMRPAYDVEETDSHYVLSFDLPGMKQEDINIEVQDRVLSISGERKREEKGVRHSERFYGRFERQFTLPDNVNADSVEANYEHGVLKIALPKLEEVKPKKVQIGVNSNKEGSFFSRLTGRAAKDVQ